MTNTIAPRIRIIIHPQENIFIVSLSKNFNSTQMTPITRSNISAGYNDSNMSAFHWINNTFLNHCPYKIRAETVAQLAVIRHIQDQEVSLFAWIE